MSAVDKIIEECRRTMRVCQANIDTEMLLPGVTLDEVSVLFPSEATLTQFVNVASQSGLAHHFATVPYDVFDQTYGRSEEGVPNFGKRAFGVRFEFLRPAGCDWRIEGMAVLPPAEGRQPMAPLHKRALSHSAGGPVVVHVSYKVGNAIHHLQSEEARLDESANMGRTDLGRLASYRNSYGAFTYYAGGLLGHVYLKPRVNLRDG